MEDDVNIKNNSYNSIQESDDVWVKSELTDEIDLDEPPNSSGDTIDNSEILENALDINNESFDSVYFLLNNYAESLTHEQKLDLKSKIARPKLNFTQSDGMPTQSFPEMWYKKYRWLAGCKTNQTYHCYHCLMFGGEEAWTKRGMTILKNFELRASKHAISRLHIMNSELFHMLGRQKVDYSNSEYCRVETEKHNSNVARNRKVVSRLIDVICYLGKQEQTFDGNDFGKGNYLETLSMLAMEEGLIKDHLETNTEFHATSSEVQTDLIESVTIAMKELIQDEINEVNFVSIQMDQNTDVCIKAPLSIIVRYVHSEKIVERFLGFYDVSNDKSAEALSKIIINVIEKYNMEKKFICQTYDGASLCGVQAIIHQKYPAANLVHSYQHHLNLVLLQKLRSIKEVKKFIGNLAAFDSFFGISSSRAQLLRKQGFQLPDAEQRNWNYRSLAVRTIKHHYKELRCAVSHVIESDNWDPESVNNAKDLQKILDSLMFTFLICLFNKILICSEHLFQVFETMGSDDVNYCMKEVREAKTNIISLRSEYVVLKCVKESFELNTNIQIDNDFEPELFVEAHKKVSFQILDSTLEQLEERFSNFEDVSFVELLNHKNFKKYKKCFPDAQFHKLISYPGFNFGALRNELINIYNSEDKAIPCAELLRFIINNELQSVYEQTMMLICLILTIPLSPANKVNTLQRIKTYLRNSMINNLPSNITTIAIEKELSQSCCKNPSFKERVIDILSQRKKRHLELIYRKT